MSCLSVKVSAGERWDVVAWQQELSSRFVNFAALFITLALYSCHPG
jgi:hypothetical protein